jgi:hypothetical protein
MKDLEKDKVFHGMKWTKNMEFSIKINTRNKKMNMINGDFQDLFLCHILFN